MRLSEAKSLARDAGRYAGVILGPKGVRDRIGILYATEMFGEALQALLAVSGLMLRMVVRGGVSRACDVQVQISS